MITIFHNPRCSKSRKTLEIIESNNLKPRIRNYLKDNLSITELNEIIGLLKIDPKELVRTNEKIYSNLFEKNNKLNKSEIIKILYENPILIQRPIVINGKKAIIGRPPENVLDIL
ncbi:arsenate reductase (glutaredoxin) [Alphaproteobacteria bacterium]|nr:arsenate reductase (glutaredoxin) [Alphaproteobacteria bacterium]